MTEVIVVKVDEAEVKDSVGRHCFEMVWCWGWGEARCWMWVNECTVVLS